MRRLQMLKFAMLIFMAGHWVIPPDPLAAHPRARKRENFAPARNSAKLWNLLQCVSTLEYVAGTRKHWILFAPLPDRRAARNSLAAVLPSRGRGGCLVR